MWSAQSTAPRSSGAPSSSRRATRRWRSLRPASGSLVLKGTPYGRRILVGEESVAWSDLEAAFERIGEGRRPARRARRRQSTDWTDESVATLIKTRVAIPTATRARTSRSRSRRGRLDLRRLRQLHAGGRQHAPRRRTRGRARRLGSALVTAAAGALVRGRVTAFTDAGEVEADAAVIAIPARRSARSSSTRRSRARPRPPSPGSSTGRTRSCSWRCGRPPSPARSCRSRGTSGPTRSSGPTANRRRFDRIHGDDRGDRVADLDGPAGWVDRAGRAALGARLDPDPGSALLSTWHDDPWVRGAYSARSISSPLRDEDLAKPIGPLHFAGEHTAGEWHGLMEGALRSGRRAARQILDA